MTCRISVYYIRNKGFLSYVISVSRFRLYRAGEWFTIRLLLTTHWPQHALSIAAHYCTGSATTCTDAYKPFKCPSMPHHQHEKVQAHHARLPAAILASSLPTCSIEDCRAGVSQGTAQPLACVPGGRLPLVFVGVV